MHDKSDVFAQFARLHHRQQAIQVYAERYYKEHYTTPTNREISAACGIPSLQSVNHHVTELVKRGWLDKEPNVARGLCIRRWYTPQPLLWTAGHDPLDLLVEYLQQHLPEDLRRQVAERLSSDE